MTEAEREALVEAMARGIHDANPGVHEPWANIVAAEALGNRLAARTAALRRAEARAAIRALPPGWMVAKVPEQQEARHGASLQKTWWRHGHNYALSEIRASAVTP